MIDIFTLADLTKIFNENQGVLQSSIYINEVMTDSRKEANNGLFIPIDGDNFDSHNFINQAIENGAIATLWERNKPLPSGFNSEFPVFFVEDTIKALQHLATDYRFMVNPIVVGITGSNGKTTTKDIVSTILASKYKTHATLGNLNNHIGLPLTILSMAPDTEVLVLEMGMNHFDEIDLLSRLSQPDYAIITNIGESHIEFLGSREGIAKAKLEITHGLKEEGTLIIDGDEKLLETIHTNHHLITCGFGQQNKLKLENVSLKENSTYFQLSEDESYELPLLGKHHAKNASYGIAVAKQLGMKPDEIKTALLQLNTTSMRFERLTGVNGVSIINDAYNASPTSMIAAIEVIKAMEGYKNKILVLGDIFELGDQSRNMHESLSTSITAPITALFTLGNDIKSTNAAVEESNEILQNEHFETIAALIEALQPYLNESCLILFKASRGMEFEKIVDKLK